jgi:hypothetical protein
MQFVEVLWLNLGWDALFLIVETRYVLDSLILSLSLLSFRIEKQITMQEHNELESWSTMTFLLQLIQNIIKCPYTINKNYKQNMKRDE